MKPRRVNFDIIAKPYHMLGYLTLGYALQKTRLHYLPAVAHSTNALVLGDGDGRFLVCLLAANPDLRATAIDISAAMLRLYANAARQPSLTPISACASSRPMLSRSNRPRPTTSS